MLFAFFYAVVGLLFFLIHLLLPLTLLVFILHWIRWLFRHWK